MIALPDTATLLPQTHTLAGGHHLYALPSAGTPLVRLDFLHEAGAAYQPQMLCAAATNRLYTAAAGSMNAAAMSEFMDYRGIVEEHNPDQLACTTTFYFLRRYLDELAPVLDDILTTPSFPEENLAVYRNKRKQELLAAQMKTGETARRTFYRALFGDKHPLGLYAVPDDTDLLTSDLLRAYFKERYREMDIVVSGCIDDNLLATVSRLARVGEHSLSRMDSLPQEHITEDDRHLTVPVSGATQTTLRVGRVLPLSWDDPDYSYFMLLTTLLGGYFGSRLMSNLREDKGFTYGVAARTQIFRGVIVFYITTDVAAGTAEAAEGEIRRELQRLCDEPVGDDELELVKTVMTGDFIRSVDGIFERAERLCNMLSSGITERFTDNLRLALESTSTEKLQSLAQRLLQPQEMVYCRAGV